MLNTERIRFRMFTDGEWTVGCVVRYAVEPQNRRARCRWAVPARGLHFLSGRMLRSEFLESNNLGHGSLE
jgi:hypothetical protein